jgi:hypothetical protein
MIVLGVDLILYDIIHVNIMMMQNVRSNVTNIHDLKRRSNGWIFKNFKYL